MPITIEIIQNGVKFCLNLLEHFCADFIEPKMRRSRAPASSSSSTSGGTSSGPSSSSSGGNNTVPSLLKELHSLVLQIQVHSLF